MKARFVFACAAAGIAMSALGATPASADEEFFGTIGFSSDWARRGETVEIFGTCNDPNFTTAQLSSDAFEPAELTGTADGHGGFTVHGTARVRAAVAPEWWPVSFMCGDMLVLGRFKVAGFIGLPKAEVTVDPQKGAPGAKVNIGVLCSEPVPVTSKALEVGKLEPALEYDVDNPRYAATATVKDVKPGVYDVATNCGSAEITTTFTVLGDAPAPAPKAKAQVPVKPKGAADTGSLDRPAVRTAAPAEGSDTGLLVLGGSALAALGAAGGVGAWAYRRRQRV
jgi:hypothetical protein